MTNRLSFTQLIDWLEGRLPEDEAKVITLAVQADESYQASVAWLRSFLGFSKSTVLTEPPADIAKEAMAYYRAFVQGKRQPGWLQSLVATLTSDSWQRPSLAGVRSMDLDTVPRQLVYTVSTSDIVINIRAGTDKDTFDLIGQLFPTDGSDPASFTVQLTLRGQELEAALTHTNKMGKFTCTRLPNGVYTLIIRGDQAEITIADVELSA